MFSVIRKDWHAVASGMHSVETGKVVSLGKPKGYEDWLNVDCGIPEHKEVKQLRSGDQHLDPAEGVSSHFPRQSVRVITPRTSASTHSKAQFGSVRTIMLACTNSPSQGT